MTNRAKTWASGQFVEMTYCRRGERARDVQPRRRPLNLVLLKVARVVTSSPWSRGREPSHPVLKIANSRDLLLPHMRNCPSVSLVRRGQLKQR